MEKRFFPAIEPCILSFQVNPRDNRLLFEVFDENRVVSLLLLNLYGLLNYIVLYVG